VVFRVVGAALVVVLLRQLLRLLLRVDLEDFGFCSETSLVVLVGSLTLSSSKGPPNDVSGKELMVLSKSSMVYLLLVCTGSAAATNAAAVTSPMSTLDLRLGRWMREEDGFSSSWETVPALNVVVVAVVVTVVLCFVMSPRSKLDLRVRRRREVDNLVGSSPSRRDVGATAPDELGLFLSHRGGCGLSEGRVDSSSFSKDSICTRMGDVPTRSIPRNDNGLRGVVLVLLKMLVVAGEAE
jgi:hypothetical protein